jgi:hypothetical protein
MAEYAWNHTYVAGDKMFHPDAYLPFVRAINERLRAISVLPISEDLGGHSSLSLREMIDIHNPSPPTSSLWKTLRVALHAGYTATMVDGTHATRDAHLFDPDSFHYPVTSYDATAFTPAAADPVFLDIVANSVYPTDYAFTASWRTLVILVDALKSRFRDPAAPDIAGTGNAWPVLSDRANWPGASGWTRKREREIYSLADTGSAGERARYIWVLSGTHEGVQTLRDKDGDPPPLSPVGELSYATKLLTHNGVTWVLDADQSGRPDTLTLYGLPVAGDLFGPWILNDLQTALNDCVWTGAGGFIDDPGGMVADVGLKDLTNYEAGYIDPIGPWTFGGAVAGVQAAWFDTATPYLTGTGNNYVHLPGNPFQVGAGFAVAGDYTEGTADKATAQPVIDLLPTHCAHTVTLYVFSPSNDFGEPWEASDSGLTGPDVWTNLQTVGPTTNTAIEFNTIGNPATCPNPPPDAGPDSSLCRFVVTDYFYLVKWNVAGGFQYVA